MSDACPVCGAEMDEYGCLGRFTDRHAVAELERLRNKLRTLLVPWKARACEALNTHAGLVRKWGRGDDTCEARAEAYEECAAELEQALESEP